MQVMVDGLLTSYEVSGKGQVVVLLHGWGDRAVGLKSLQTVLAQDFKVITPDLPGFGGSEAPKQPWDLTSYAKFIAAFLKKIDAGNVYAFIGHSYGGALAIRGISQNVLHANKLVLLASAGIRGTYSARNKTLRLLAKAGKVFTSPLPATVRQRLKRRAYHAIGSDMFVAEHLQETFKKIVTDDVRADAARVNVPTLLLYGDADRATPVQFGELLHELLPASTLEVLPGAGHFLFRDRPEETLKAVREFL